ncbi:LCP family protein [Enterococcus casseliflavus]|uniref:LCP family glycopolymer transferase n=1 Tax=Enterococcus casseliflavus TaxID=37734 RepID=UPI0035CC149A
MSKGKKIFFIIFGIVAVLVIGIVGVGAKLYMDLSGSIQKAYESVERDQNNEARKTPLDLDKQEAFTVLLLGIDTGDLGRTDQGRSDALMVVTVNPNDGQTTVVSIPRDTYVEIVGRGTDDKINHAYAFGGAAMSMDTVQKYLDIPIDHYVAMNMAGIKELVDAVGGVDVNNDLKFEKDDYTFDIGKIHLDGDQALSYTRMRYDDPSGDYGRQGRQRNIVAAVAKKALSLEGVIQYQQVLNAMEGNMKTDMDFSTMQKIALDYRNAFGKIEQVQMQGDGFMQDGISYQRVSEDELARVQKILKEQLGTTN